MIDKTQIKALASPQRIEILRLLADPAKHFSHQWSADPATDGVCISLIVEALGLSQPTVSRHLEVLKQAGFIEVKQLHRWSHCKRVDSAIRQYLAAIQDSLQL